MNKDCTRPGLKGGRQVRLQNSRLPGTCRCEGMACVHHGRLGLQEQIGTHAGRLLTGVECTRLGTSSACSSRQSGVGVECRMQVIHEGHIGQTSVGLTSDCEICSHPSVGNPVLTPCIRWHPNKLVWVGLEGVQWSWMSESDGLGRVGEGRLPGVWDASRNPRPSCGNMI